MSVGREGSPALDRLLSVRQVDREAGATSRVPPPAFFLSSCEADRAVEGVMPPDFDYPGSWRRSWRNARRPWRRGWRRPPWTGPSGVAWNVPCCSSWAPSSFLTGAAGATWLGVRRATRVDPVEVLRG